MNRFEWYATESAHERFPMQVVRGRFIFKDSSTFYIPDGYLGNNGWGETGALHVAGATYKQIPVKVYIHWFSYAEDKFYEGTFDLPYEKILALFKEGTEDRGGGYTDYRHIAVGLAPEGEVSVFLCGIGTTVEVVNNLRAKEVETDWTTILNNKQISRSDWIREQLGKSLTDEQINDLQKNGIPKGLMDSYRQQFPWKPEAKNCRFKKLEIQTLNGETEFFNFEKLKERRTTRGIIKQADISFWDLKGARYYVEIPFREETTIASFEHFLKNVLDENTVVEFVYREEPRTLNRLQVLRTFNIYLKNSDSKIKLETDKFDIWLKE